MMLCAKIFALVGLFLFMENIEMYILRPGKRSQVASVDKKTTNQNGFSLIRCVTMKNQQSCSKVLSMLVGDIQCIMKPSVANFKESGAKSVEEGIAQGMKNALIACLQQQIYRDVEDGLFSDKSLLRDIQDKYNREGLPKRVEKMPEKTQNNRILSLTSIQQHVKNSITSRQTEEKAKAVKNVAKSQADDASSYCFHRKENIFKSIKQQKEKNPSACSMPIGEKMFQNRSPKWQTDLAFTKDRERRIARNTWVKRKNSIKTNILSKASVTDDLEQSLLDSGVGNNIIPPGKGKQKAEQSFQ